jgi:hypothetical protein
VRDTAGPRCGLHRDAQGARGLASRRPGRRWRQRGHGPGRVGLGRTTAGVRGEELG